MGKFNIKSLEPIKIKKGTKLFKNKSTEFFHDHEKVIEALTHILLEGDREGFHEVFSQYLSIINKEELSRLSNVPIATIRRMAAGANFNIDSMLKITSAIHKEIAS